MFSDYYITIGKSLLQNLDMWAHFSGERESPDHFCSDSVLVERIMVDSIRGLGPASFAQTGMLGLGQARDRLFSPLGLGRLQVYFLRFDQCITYIWMCN